MSWCSHMFTHDIAEWLIKRETKNSGISLPTGIFSFGFSVYDLNCVPPPPTPTKKNNILSKLSIPVFSFRYLPELISKQYQKRLFFFLEFSCRARQVGPSLSWPLSRKQTLTQKTKTGGAHVFIRLLMKIYR